MILLCSSAIHGNSLNVSIRSLILVTRVIARKRTNYWAKPVNRVALPAAE